MPPFEMSEMAAMLDCIDTGQLRMMMETLGINLDQIDRNDALRYPRQTISGSYNSADGMIGQLMQVKAKLEIEATLPPEKVVPLPRYIVMREFNDANTLQNRKHTFRQTFIGMSKCYSKRNLKDLKRGRD